MGTIQLRPPGNLVVEDGAEPLVEDEEALRPRVRRQQLLSHEPNRWTNDVFGMGIDTGERPGRDAQQGSGAERSQG
jgi:hypothetical protein